MTCFLDRYNRPLRIVWRGITRVGNCTGLRGNCTGLRGDLDECDITDEDRKKGIDIAELVG